MTVPEPSATPSVDAVVQKLRCTQKIKATFTDEEKVGLARILDAASCANDFAAYARGGVIKRTEFNDLSVFYKEAASDGRLMPRVLDLPASIDGMQKLWEAATPSAHGQGDKLVLDTSYRQARELTNGRFSLTFDPLPFIIEDVSKMRSSQKIILLAKMAKLNIYGKDGFFKAHRDTPRGTNHIGSIVVCLPGAFTGGELVVRRDGRQQTFAWSEACGEGDIGWAFLYSDCDHEVLPVTSGSRLTVAYDVFVSKPVMAEAVDIKNTDVYHDLAYIRDHVKQTRFLAYHLQHDYSDTVYESVLKGVDAIVYKAAKALDLKCDIGFQGGVGDEEDDWRDQNSDEDDDEATSSDDAEDTTANTWEISSSAHLGLNGYYNSDGDISKASTGEKRSDLIWITSSGGSGFVGGHYINYGNEPSLDSIYVSGLLIITIPGADAEELAQAREKRRPWYGHWL